MVNKKDKIVCQVGFNELISSLNLTATMFAGVFIYALLNTNYENFRENTGIIFIILFVIMMWVNYYLWKKK